MKAKAASSLSVLHLLLRTQLAGTKEQSGLAIVGCIQGLFGPPATPGHFIWGILNIQGIFFYTLENIDTP